MIFRILVGALCLTWAQTAAAQDSWADLAQRDLTAIHDTLRDNHPGAVDPNNPSYREWLDQGLVAARSEAATASTFSGYRRAVLRYVNGFHDGHSYVFGWPTTSALWWSGVVVGMDAQGAVRVTSAADDVTLPPGSILLACDGQPVAAMMAARIEPYYYNADLPHSRASLAPRLMQAQLDDLTDKPRNCDFEIGGSAVTTSLAWRPVSRQVLDAMGPGGAPPTFGLKKIGEVWFVSLPTFNVSNEQAAPLRALIDQIRTDAVELRQGRVIFDMRGNGGGNSGWGNMVAAALWGDDWVTQVAAGFDNSFDARVSPANIRHVRAAAAQHRRDGMNFGWDGMADQMEQALAEGRDYVRITSAPSTPSAALANPVEGQVYLLTDGACASACLNFADLVLRLPGVTHIGLPTGADTIYIDNLDAPLPSGLGSLSYSFKAYRARVRGNNQFYSPAVPWPGGAMTDEALADWVEHMPLPASMGRTPS